MKLEYKVKENNLNNVEILRDFNGWSWNPMPKLMTNINFNILYQTLLLLLGNNFMESWQFQLQLDGKNTNWLFEARKTIAKKSLQYQIF